MGAAFLSCMAATAAEQRHLLIINAANSHKLRSSGIFLALQVQNHLAAEQRYLLRNRAAISPELQHDC
jgi:hypothetical protein